MNKKKILIITLSAVLAVVLIVTIILLATCNKGKPNDGEKPDNPDNPHNPPITITVGVPTNVAIDDKGIVTWTEASNAHSYELSINGTTVVSLITRYDLNDFEPKPTDNKYNVKVRGVASDGTTKGNWSEAVTNTLLEQLKYATVSGVKDGVISWTPNTDATTVILTINGVEKQLDGNVTSYDLSHETGSQLTISITYKGDSSKYRDSKTTTIIYYPDTQALQLPAPSGARMEGNVLVIDEIIGADTYYLRDYRNTIITVTTATVDMSDLYLVTTVYASNSKNLYVDSKEVEVTYFNDEQGKGTESEPYMISTSDEFRYIEYFEGVGEAKYYELDADIVFDDIALQLDQVGSNAYRLGSFSGNLDGNGNSIINLTVYYNDGYSCLFDSINQGAVVKNLVIEDANWRTWTLVSGDGIMHEKGADVSILCHTNRGTINNVTVKDSTVVSVADGASSLVSINRGTVSNCTVQNTVTINGSDETGGIAIYNVGTITDCVNNGTISGNNSVGGIVGRNNGIIEKCDNHGTIKGAKKVGGIVGNNDNIQLGGVYDFNTMVKYCSNHGTINGTREVGGIAGNNGNAGDNASVVNISGAGIYYCYNTAKVEGVSVVGGIVGNNFATLDKSKNVGVVGCYNSGSVAVSDSVREQYTRIYVRANVIKSWVTNDNSQLYLHYWGKSGSSVWPGEEMVHFAIGDEHYYYLDIPNGMLDGIKITRRDFAGVNEHNSMENNIIMQAGKNLYVFTSGFNNLGYWGEANPDVVNASYDIVGAIAGYNMAVNDCYYLESTASAVSFDNTALQSNKVIVGANEVNGTDVSKTTEQLKSQQFVDLLNSVAGANVWVKGDKYPIFSWQA